MDALIISSRDQTSIQIWWYLPDISETLDGKKRYPTLGVAVSDSSGGSPLALPTKETKKTEGLPLAPAKMKRGRVRDDEVARMMSWEERARARDVPSSQVEVSWQ